MINVNHHCNFPILSLKMRETDLWMNASTMLAIVKIPPTTAQI